MPCLSSSAFSDLNASIRVSKAESQLALPLAITTFFASSVISSPKGSAVCTGAQPRGGVWRGGLRGRAAAVRALGGRSRAGRRRGARRLRRGGSLPQVPGDVRRRRALAMASEIAATGDQRGQGEAPAPGIHASNRQSRTKALLSEAGHTEMHSVFARYRLAPAKLGCLTRERALRPMTDMSWGRCRHRAGWSRWPSAAFAI